MTKPTETGLSTLMGSAMFTDRWRDRVCVRCAASFVQRELSPAFQKIVAGMPHSAQLAWAAAVPDNALPLFCVKCERRDLAGPNQVIHRVV